MLIFSLQVLQNYSKNQLANAHTTIYNAYCLDPKSASNPLSNAAAAAEVASVVSFLCDPAEWQPTRLL